MIRKVNIPKLLCAIVVMFWLAGVSITSAQQPTPTATVTPGLPPPTLTPTQTLTLIPTAVQPLVSTPIDRGNISSLTKGRSWLASQSAIDGLVFIADHELVTAPFNLDRIQPNTLMVWTLNGDSVAFDENRFENSASLSTQRFVNLRLSNDGTRLIALGNYTAVWNLDTGRFVAMVGHAGATSVAYDRFFVVGSTTGLVSLWDVPMAKLSGSTAVPSPTRTPFTLHRAFCKVPSI